MRAASCWIRKKLPFNYVNRMTKKTHCGVGVSFFLVSLVFYVSVNY